MTATMNFDAPARPQRVTIIWTMETPGDTDPTPPDERQDGFWPSSDPEAPGYVEPGKYGPEMLKAGERMRTWKRCDWWYVGVVARADVAIPIGGDSFVMHSFRSAGLWGVESDAGDYLREMYAEQKTELLGQLQTLATALQSATFDQEESA